MPFPWPSVLATLLAARDLDEQTATDAMRSIMSGEASAGQIGAFLVALRAKGETEEEIAGFARAMRALSLKVEVDGPLVDTCGTGGDGAGTANISTMAALVVAGAGARVAKHGNRAASSQAGSADVLEALGVTIELPPEGVARCIEEAGIGFCFAPAFHPAMRHAGPVRRELGIPTVFNFLGPLTNPAGASRQVIGVSDAAMAPKIARALALLGVERALVVRGDDGLDELTTTTTSTVWEVDGGVRASSFDPESAGIARAPAHELRGGTAEDNAAIARRVLGGEPSAVAEAVVLNSGAALVVAGVADDVAAGVARARSVVASGAAAAALERLREVSQRVRPS